MNPMAIPSNKLANEKKRMENQSYNLLAIPGMKKFIQSRWYPGIFQWIVLIVFSIIVFELVAGTVDPSRNLGTSLTWVLWWPLIPLFFVTVGRFWCAICPFGKVSDIIRKTIGSKRPAPKFLKKYGLWLIDLFFIAITYSDHVWGVVENPRGSGYLLLLLVTMVVGSSVFYERRTFCKNLCFLGGLSGNYSRAGSLELRGTPEVCKTCKTQACFKGTEKAEGCPMFQFARTMDTSADCNLCGNCVKNCPNNSIRISPRIPTSELWGIRRPRMEHTVLAAVIMGIVFVQNITMLTIWGDILKGIEAVTGTNNYVVNFTIAFVISMMIPVGLLLLTAKITTLLGGSVEKVKTNFVRFGYAIIPLDLAGHLAHNLFHIITEGKAIWYNTAAFLGIHVTRGDLAFASASTVQMLQYAIIVIGTIGSLYTAYRIGNKGKFKVLMPYYTLMFLLAVANIYLFSMPMMHRV